MNGRMSKKLRKIALRISTKNDIEIANDFKTWVNSLPLKDRIHIAWKAIRGAM